jgi:hypothetical protein
MKQSALLLKVNVGLRAVHEPSKNMYLFSRKSVVSVIVPAKLCGRDEGRSWGVGGTKHMMNVGKYKSSKYLELRTLKYERTLGCNGTRKFLIFVDSKYGQDGEI